MQNVKMNKPYSPKQSERVSEQLNVRDLFRTKQIAFSEIDPRRNLETSYCSVVCLMPLCQLHFRHLLLLAKGQEASRISGDPTKRLVSLSAHINRELAVSFGKERTDLNKVHGIQLGVKTVFSNVLISRRNVT